MMEVDTGVPVSLVSNVQAAVARPDTARSYLQVDHVYRGTIEPVEFAEWAAPIVYVMKPDNIW